MRDISTISAQVVKRFGTRDPFEIAESLGLIILRVNLIEVRGFLQVIRRIGVVYIDADLDDQQSRLVCAHELGHWFLHKGLNRAFLDTYTHFRGARFELEANRFAAYLLFGDDDLIEFATCPVEKIACVLGITPELAEYRMRGFQLKIS